jgi:LysM repeat protein
VSDVAYGIDVSRWQKGFNLNNAKAQGFTYCIAKAGGADSGYYKDKCFENFYQQAKALGMNVGAYYFGCAFSVEDAIREASYFISYLAGKQITHVYYDVEGSMLNQGYRHLTDIINAFCQTMINNGYACGIYTSESHFNSRFNDALLIQYPHWVAKYSKNPPKLKSIALVEIWQYGGSVNYVRDPKIAGTTVDQDQINIEWADAPVLTEKPVIVPIENKKNVDQLANEVLAGLWGNGIIRKAKLNLAGYDYNAVQNRVNEIIEQRKQTKKTHIVAKGETLSGIAKRYNTTVDALVKANGIPNKNKIYVGQELIIA